jgi:hypothetical protein
VLTVQVVLHFSLASLFTYLLVRHLVRRAGLRLVAARFAGGVAALAFTYGGYLTSFPVQQLTILETAVWLPLVLLFVDRAAHSPRPFSQSILAGVALACGLLAGHPQTALYLVYTVAAYGLFVSRAVVPAHGRDGALHYVRRVGWVVGLPMVLGAGLAAVQLVPTIGFIARSTRAGLDFEAVSWGFPLVETLHLLYPGYFGGSPQYVGLLPMALVAAAVLVRRIRREVTFWGVLGLVALLLAFGRHTFLYSVAYLLAPGFGAVRDQERVIFLFSFSVSILAGYGATVLVQPLPRLVRRALDRYVRWLGWVVAGFVALTAIWYAGYVHGLQQGVEINLFEGVLRHHVLLLFCLGGALALFGLRRSAKVRRRWLVAGALGLIWLNLFTVNWRFNLGPHSGDGPFPETGLTAYLRAQPGTFRVSSAGLLPGGSSAGIAYELEDVTGNTPLLLDAFQRFEDEVGSWQRWQLLNVEYVLSDRELGGPGLAQVYEEGQVRVYRVADPLPRAWMVHHAEVADDRQVLGSLGSEGFDPRSIAYLAPESGQGPLSSGERGGTAAEVVEAWPGRLVVEFVAPDDGLLVISQPFYPGWRAELDGEPTMILRANYFLQGVLLDAGPHRVELQFRPSIVPMVISLLVLSGCVTALGLSWRRKASSEAMLPAA